MPSAAPLNTGVRPLIDTTSMSIDEIPNPLRQVLRDYLHVEWYELSELALDATKPEWIKRLGGFKMQLRDAILLQNITTEAVYKLTGQEFEDQTALNAWLSELWSAIYEEPPQK